MDPDQPMEKRNIIEDGRTPDMQKQADADDFEEQMVKAFEAVDAKPKEDEKPHA